MDNRLTPEFVALSKRMHKIASASQLQLNPQCINIISSAIHVYLQRTLASVTTIPTAYVCPHMHFIDIISITQYDDIEKHEAQLEVSLPGEISTIDIEKATLRRPKLLGDNHASLQFKFRIENE